MWMIKLKKLKVDRTNIVTFIWTW